MLFQPTNIIPDELNGAGVVDLTEGLQISWQVNGDSPMTGYAINIKTYNSDNVYSYTLANDVSPVFWGRGYSGDVQRFYVSISYSDLHASGITNGSDYSITITQKYSDNGVTKEVKQLASSIFHARSKPVLSLPISSTITTKDATFDATFNQAQGDSIDSIRWILIQVGHEDEPLQDTGTIHGTGILKFIYNGFLNNTSYAIRCIVVTQYGAVADTGWKTFNVQYSTQQNTGTVTVCQAKNENCVLVQWSATSGATEYSVMRKEKDGSRLEKVSDVSSSQGREIKDYGAKSGKTYQYYVFPSDGTRYIKAAQISAEIQVNYKYWAIHETIKYKNEEFAVLHSYYFRVGEGGIKEGKLSNNNSPSLLQNFTRFPTRQGTTQNYKTGSLTGLVGTVDESTRTYSDTVDEADAIMELSTSNNILFLTDPKGHFLQIHIKDAITLQGSVSKKLMPQTITIPWVEVGDSERISVIAMMSTMFSLVYDANGGSNPPSPESHSVEKTEYTFTISTTKPTRTGYTFDRWNTESDGSGKTYIPGGSIVVTAENPTIRLYAQWISNTKYTYTINYDERFESGGETFGEIIVDQVITGTTSYAFTLRSDYSNPFLIGELLGWSETKDATSPTYLPGEHLTLTSVNRTKTLYPVIDSGLVEVYNYQLNYYGNGSGDTVVNVPSSISDPSSDEVHYMGKISSRVPRRSGHTFVGWCTEANGAGRSWVAGEDVYLTGAENPVLNLYAIWDSGSAKYTMSFMPNAGSDTVWNMPDMQESINGMFTIPNNQPTRNGYVFTGWDSNRSATIPTYSTPGATVIVSSTSYTNYLYAIWAEEIEPGPEPTTGYTIMFDGNGGSDTVSNVPSDLYSSTSATFTIPNVTPVRTSELGMQFTFLGWSLYEDATTASYTQNQTVTIDSELWILYAVWRTEQPYTLYYNANAGSDTVTNMPTSPQRSEIDNILLDEAEPSREGYSFLGWSTNSEATVAQYVPGEFFDDFTGYTATLYAVWGTLSFTLTFNKNNTSTTYNLPNDMTAPQTTSSHTFTIPGNVPYLSSMENRMFMGWDTSSDGTGTRYAEGDTITLTTSDPDVPLYAIWEMPSYYYTLSFNANGGTGAPGSLTQETQSTTASFEIPSTVPTKDGAIFAGWADSPGASELDVYEESIQVSATPYPTRLLGMIWEQGNLDTVANNGVEIASSTAIRTDGYMNFNYIGNKQVRIKCPYGTRMYLYSYTKSGDTYTCQSRVYIDGGSRLVYYTRTPVTDYYYRLVAWNSSGDALTPDSSKVENINMSYTVDKTVYAIWME